MTDLLTILPTFPVKQYTHLLPSLEKNFITTTDLLTLDALEVSKRARLPLLDIRRLTNAVVAALQGELGIGPDGAVSGGVEMGDRKGRLRRTGVEAIEGWKTVSTLDEKLDAALKGGIPTGHITEFTGESAAGKTQFLLTLSLAAQLPPTHGGLSKSALYIATESPISTRRLSQLLSSIRSRFPDVQPPPSMDRVLSIICADLEVQEHILNYQLEVAIQRYGVGLVAIDSVAANFRAELGNAGGAGGVGGANMAKRSVDLLRLGQLLRHLAREHDVAIVVANQVSDRFGPAPPAPSSSSSSSSITTTTRPADILTLDHQQRWFTGWGDEYPIHSPSLPNIPNPKTPSLGLTWTNCLSARIALIKEPVYGGADAVDGEVGGEKELLRWRRWMKIVFAPWAEGGRGTEVEFVITTGGVKATEVESENG
ncbi:hypothetical protein FGG08_003024 [Glutinoglossum americanum]|uniref:RecA family profile 1 domain-containing protein n=1 Tax=Glutinoglossum americanum TaxID=1670608 RepID=A0A9P8L403_9PEZI|nr:hypothetical protein FGG08_003024 [Glutinoglossum americanum]